MTKRKLTDTQALSILRQDPRVEAVFSEYGNLEADKEDWWVWLKSGYQCDPQCHTIHEQTLQECVAQMTGVTTCQCKDCKQSLTAKKEQHLK